MENKGYEIWKEWMIQDSILFDELIKANLEFFFLIMVKILSIY